MNTNASACKPSHPHERCLRRTFFELLVLQSKGMVSLSQLSQPAAEPAAVTDAAGASQPGLESQKQHDVAVCLTQQGVQMAVTDQQLVEDVLAATGNSQPL